VPGRSNPKAIEIAVPSIKALFAEFHARPIIERSRTDEQAVKTALRADFLAHSGSHLKAARFSHRERLSAFIGIAILLISIVVSTTLERLTGNVIVAGIAQGIVVLGWVALWAPAQRFAIGLIPHRFERRSYARLAQLNIRVEYEEHDVTTVKTDGASAAQRRPADQ